MKTLEELDKEYAEKKAELIIEHEIAAQLPVQPKFISGAKRRNPYVCYEAQTMREAVALADKFVKATYVNAKGTYRHVCPESLIRSEYNESLKFCHEIVDGTPFIEAQSANWGSEFSLVFWVEQGDKFLRISIRVKRYPFQWMPHCVWAGSNHDVKPVRKHFPNVPGATTINFSWSDDQARVCYVWGDDSQFRAALTTLPEFQDKEVS